MRDRRDGDDLQTTHARVVEALDAAVAAHPAGARRNRSVAAADGAPTGSPTPIARRRPLPRALPTADDDRAPSRLRRAGDGVVVPLRAKVVALHPHGPGDEPEGPSAA